jgi:hypothetical protein
MRVEMNDLDVPDRVRGGRITTPDERINQSLRKGIGSLHKDMHVGANVGNGFIGRTAVDSHSVETLLMGRILWRAADGVSCLTPLTVRVYAALKSFSYRVSA